MILKHVLKTSLKKDLNEFIEVTKKLNYSLYDVVSTLNVLNIQVSLNFFRNYMRARHEDMYCNILSVGVEELHADNIYDTHLKLLRVIKTKYTYLNHISNPMSFLSALLRNSDEMMMYFIIDDYFTQIKEKENVISN